jgi:hypothetical protein
MGKVEDGVRFELDYSGLGSIMRGRQMAQVITAKAHEIAENLTAHQDSDEVRLFVDPYTTDRAAAAVTIQDPRAVDNELLYGQLEQAARDAGLEFSSEQP